jgi:hypothetical protein
MNVESGYCYIILFSNGLIKGGKSGDIFKRYKTHKATAIALGISVKSTFYTESHLAYHANEKRLLSALSAVSEERVGEFFRGVTEASAIEALNSLGLAVISIEEWIFIPQEAFLTLAAYRLTGETYSVMILKIRLSILIRPVCLLEMLRVIPRPNLRPYPCLVRAL